MKQFFPFLLAFLLFSSCNREISDKQDIPTYFTFMGEIGTNDNSTLVSADNNLIICGNHADNISILKISKSGDQIWRKDFYAGNQSSSDGIVESGTRDLFICGSTSRNYSSSGIDVLLVKADSNGDTIWTKTYGGIKDDYGFQIIKTNDDNILISGISYSYSSLSFCDIYLVKINSDGDTLWTRNFPDEDQEVPFHLLETQNGEYLVTGTNQDNSNPRELYFLKVSSSGEQLWYKKIGPTWKWGYSTIELNNGDLLTCGHHTIGQGYSQVMLLKTDKYGSEYWEKEFGDSLISEQANSIRQNLDGTYTITGSSYDVKTMQSDIILLKVDQIGNQVWFHKFGGSVNAWGENLIKDSNDDNIITGDYNDSIFMVRIDKKGVFK
jgi:hypothetical protein